MKKNKKIIIAIIIIFIIIATVVVIMNNNKASEEEKIEESNVQEEEGISKLTVIRDELSENKDYKIKLIFNDENQRIISRKGNLARVEVIDEGKKNIYIVNGDEETTCILDEETKEYHEYKNNATLLNDFIENINNTIKKNYTIGTENIENKEYKYEEFEKTSAFVINYKSNIDDMNAKTRVYFEGNDLKYIKTYIGNVEQLLKVEIENENQNSQDFEIPAEYTQN